MNDSGLVTGLYRRREKGTAPEAVISGCFIRNIGLEGDRHAAGSDRQVTLKDAAAEEWMSRQQRRGLCFERFRENITVSGFDFGRLRPGDLLEAGEVGLRITGCSKKCYPEDCKLFTQDDPCPLPRWCLFAAVTKSGQMSVGDKIKLI